MKPCCVKMEKIKNLKGLIDEHKADKQRRYKCYFCRFTNPMFPVVHNHVLKSHPHKTVFNCDYVACLKLFFSSKEEKNKHMEEQHSSNNDRQKVLVRCVHCERVYLDKRSLWAHVKLRHQNFIDLRCNFGNCVEYLKSEADRQQHIMEVHGNKKNAIKCTYCDKVFPKTKSLNTHTKKTHGNTMIMCHYQNCSSFFKCEADRLQHEKEKHLTSGNIRKCVYCDRWVVAIRSHVSSYHKNIAIGCNYSASCSSYFKSKSDRDKHVQTVHQVTKIRPTVECIYCGKSYRHSIFKHMKIMHAGETPIRCSIFNCTQYFKSQEDCDKHFKEIHQEKQKLQNFFCPKCSYKTHDRSFLKYHFQRIHDGKEKLKCTQCPASHRTYRSAVALKLHIRITHLDIKKCPHCNKSMHKYKLTAHLLSEYCYLCNVNYQCAISMKEHKKWCKRKCEICLKVFRSAFPLLRHVTDFHKIVNVTKLTWLGDLRNLKKNVKCEICECCFYDSRAFSRHVKSVHSDQQPWLSCDHCKKQFPQRALMEKHMISDHGFISMRQQ